QKGMGLIMLILVGTVPLTYALNHAMPESHTPQFVAVAQATQAQLRKEIPQASGTTLEDTRKTVSDYLRTKTETPALIPALAALANSIGQQVQEHGSLAKVPAAAVSNVRNDMYLASEAIRLIEKSGTPGLSADTQ